MQNAEPKVKDGERKLLDHVLAATIPMRGRMIHGKKANGELYEEAQDYDVHGRVSHSESSATCWFALLTHTHLTRQFSL